MGNPTFDVIVPQYGQPNYTLEFLDSFAEYKLPNMRLILVDNGSTHNDYNLVRDRVSALGIPNIIARLSFNSGFVRGTNVGLSLSDADYVVLQNNDTRIYRGSYQRMFDALMSDPKIGAVGPVASECKSVQSIAKIKDDPIFVDGFRGVEILKVPEEGRAELFARHLSGAKRDMHMLAFFCTMFPKAVINTFGNLSNDYGIGFGDDDDYCARLRKAGLRIVLACDSYVYHHQRSTFKAIFSETEIRSMQMKNFQIYKDKWEKK